MHTRTRKAMVSVAALFGLIALTSAPWRSSKAEEPPQIVEVQPNYEKPKTLVVNEALERCLANLSKAQDELRMLYTEGKVKRYLGVNDMWVSTIRFTNGLTNGIYSMVFESKTGPLLGFDKSVYADREYKDEYRELGYEIDYSKDGNVEHYRSRTLRAGMSFYTNGALKSFGADIDARTSCNASWDAAGKLTGEGTSSHLPEDEKTLPDWESVLRHGDYQAKFGAAGAMANIGPASIPYALNVLKDGDEDSRERAASVFILLRERGVLAVPDLVRCLHEDKSNRVRTGITRSLGLMGPLAEAAIPALEQASTNDVPEVATAAKIALERIRGPSSK